MRFDATILEPDGATVREQLEANDEQALHEQLGRAGRLLVRVRTLERAAATVATSDRLRLPPARLLLLTQALYETLDAGLPMLQAFEAIGGQDEDRDTAEIMAVLSERVAAGSTFSSALEAFPRTFSPVYRAMVRAGEQSGRVPEVLHSMAEFLEWRIEIAGTVRQAMVYPMIVGTAGYAMVLFLLGFVIPRLGEVIDKIGSDLPAASVVLIALSNFVAGNVATIVLGTIAALVLAVHLLRRPVVRGLVLDASAGLPVVRGLVMTLAMAQFSRTFAVLLHSGLTMTHALELGGASVTLPRLRDRLLLARERILGGARLGEALEQHEVLPPVALSMVRVGEEAGRLPVTFERLARQYDRLAKESVKKALGLLEPIVTVVLGLVVGGVAVMVILTIYSAMRGLGR